MSMHATTSLADGVVDPVIASRAKLYQPRCTNHVLTGGPGVYTITDGIVVKAYCL